MFRENRQSVKTASQERVLGNTVTEYQPVALKQRTEKVELWETPTFMDWSKKDPDQQSDVEKQREGTVMGNRCGVSGQWLTYS